MYVDAYNFLEKTGYPLVRVKAPAKIRFEQNLYLSLNQIFNFGDFDSFCVGMKVKVRRYFDESEPIDDVVGECICGQKGLKHYCYIFHENVPNIIFKIGSSCINHFSIPLACGFCKHLSKKKTCDNCVAFKNGREIISSEFQKGLVRLKTEFLAGVVLISLIPEESEDRENIEFYYFDCLYGIENEFRFVLEKLRKSCVDEKEDIFNEYVDGLDLLKDEFLAGIVEMLLVPEEETARKDVVNDWLQKLADIRDNFNSELCEMRKRWDSMVLDWGKYRNFTYRDALLKERLGTWSEWLSRLGNLRPKQKEFLNYQGIVFKRYFIK